MRPKERSDYLASHQAIMQTAVMLNLSMPYEVRSQQLVMNGRSFTVNLVSGRNGEAHSKQSRESLMTKECLDFSPNDPVPGLNGAVETLNRR